MTSSPHERFDNLLAMHGPALGRLAAFQIRSLRGDVKSVAPRRVRDLRLRRTGDRLGRMRPRPLA